jgi:hypothetical protein
VTTHEWYVEHREAYVARSLEPGEERAFRNHLVHCDECARGTDRLERELGWLGMAVDPVPAEPGRARRMAGEILARPNRWRRWLRRAHQVLQTRISMDGHEGGLLIFQDAVSHRWCVIVHGLPPAPAGSVYQFWFITESGMVRSVEVNADTQRPAFMTLPMPGVRAPVMGAALTMEPVVNRSSEPRGVTLAHLVF